MIHPRLIVAYSIIGALVMGLGGCSRRPKNIAHVKGKVTVGGQPLPDALVTFAPVEPGSSSLARTNASGEYVLQYSSGYDGAQIGEHHVAISTRREGNPDAKPPVPEIPEKVPYKYRSGQDALKATVKPGSNEVDFALEAGPVEPPQAKGKKKGR